MADLATCRGCQRPILWVVTASGKHMPLDPDPTPDGTVVLGPTGTAHVLPRRGRGDAPADLVRYTAHWATCTSAATFRRREG